ncbi:general secretion pathway protein H [Salinisphaera dokdonensis CL-ES53]|uniref:General secretion pathway protein H n=1 Tax=Salinisphaera dokdonensis CL-ES53 TaxID=1304272 RepID=A0ABV2B517_9GAMM
MIIGVVMAFVSLSINPTGNADQLDKEARRLEALITTAADDAVLYGREIGLDITRGGYRFLRLGDDGWQPLAGPDTPLRPRELGGELVLALIARDEDAPQLVSADEDEDEQDVVRPEAVFLSSGEMIPFELELFSPDVEHRYRLVGDAAGTLERERIEGRR